MEILLSLAIGIVTASGVWLLFRPRTFQLVVGLSLLSYAINLFILAMGRLRMDAPPITEKAASPAAGGNRAAVTTTSSTTCA